MKNTPTHLVREHERTLAAELKRRKKWIVFWAVISVFLFMALCFLPRYAAAIQDLPTNDTLVFLYPHDIATFFADSDVHCSAKTTNEMSSLTFISENDSHPIPAPGIYDISYIFPVIFHFSPHPPPPYNFSSYYFVNNSDKEIIIMRCVGG